MEREKDRVRLLETNVEKNPMGILPDWVGSEEGLNDINGEVTFHSIASIRHCLNISLGMIVCEVQSPPPLSEEYHNDSPGTWMTSKL